LETAIQDIRHALRALARAPGFTLATAVILALGLGANAAIFGLHRAAADGSSFHGFSYPDYADLRDRGRALAGLAAFNGRGFSLGEGEEAQLVGGQIVSGNYFAVLGTQPRLGRLIEAGDDHAVGAAPVAVLSHALWQRRFHGDPGVIGRTVRLNGLPFSVVGIAPPGFIGHFVGFPFDVWAPHSMAPPATGEDLRDRNSEWLELVGRLAPGRERGEAQAELASVMGALAREHPAPGKGFGIDVRPMTGVDDSLRGPVLGFLGLLQTVAGLVLLVAAVNVAGMLLVQAVARRKEIAVRLALGAGRGRLLRRRVVEMLLLFALGGALGLLLARWTSGLLRAFQPPFAIPLHFDVEPDLRVLAFTAALALAGGLLFGLFSAREASRLDLVSALKGAASVERPRQGRVRRLFVVGQVAASVMLLVGALLFARTLQESRRLDPGFDVDRVHVSRIDLSLRPRDDESARALHARLLESLAGAPGVAAVSLARSVPLGLGGLTTKVNVPGDGAGDGDGATVGWNAVTSAYFETMGIPLVAGRAFTAADGPRAPAVAIVNQAMARRFWPGADAIGQRFRREGRSVEVVGVARDSRYWRLGEELAVHAYFPLAQSRGTRTAILVRTSGDPAAMGRLVRDTVRSVDRDLPLLESMPLSRFVVVALFPQRLASAVTGLLGALGLLLAGVGLYAVVAFSVVQRTREIGVRMALGARADHIVRMVLGEGLRLAAIGTAAGLLAAGFAAPLLTSFLPGVSPSDPASFLGTAGLMLLLALVASAVPAWRAVRVPPLVAFRSE
jgi:predicted permease